MADDDIAPDVAADRLRIVADLSERWHRHCNLWNESGDRSEIAAMRSYARAIATVLDRPYRDVEISLQRKEI